MEDTNIIKLYWARDERALLETDNKYGMRCRRMAFDILSDREDTEECVSDTYLSLWNAIPPQRPKCFPAYISRILRNLSLNRLSELRAQKRGGGELELALDELEAFVPTASSPQRELESKELAREINQFLKTLSRDERDIFLSRYWLLLPTAKISGRLGFSEAKVRTSLHRIRKKLREHLTKEGLI